MKHIFQTSLLCLGLGVAVGLSPEQARAQTGIGTRTPDGSAALDITSSNRGLLIPRVSLQSLTDASTVPNPANSLLVFNTNSVLIGGTGYYYNTGNAGSPSWVQLVGSASPIINNRFWSLTGNAGTDPGNNFLGTLDAKDLVFRTNNVQQMRLFQQSGGLGLGNLSSGNLQLGFGGASNALTGQNNTLIGINAGRVLTSGTDNTLLGTSAGGSLAGAAQNTIIGSAAGPATTGGSNTYIGYNSGLSNTSGFNNVGLGFGTGSTPVAGTFNTYIGSGADGLGNNLARATAIGYNAKVIFDDAMVLGNSSTKITMGQALTLAPSNTLTVAGDARITSLGGQAIPATNGDRLVVSNSNGELLTRSIPTALDPTTFIANNNSSPNTQQANSSFNISGNGVIGQRLGVGIGVNPPSEALQVGGNTIISGFANIGGLGTFSNGLNVTGTITAPTLNQITGDNDGRLVVIGSTGQLTTRSIPIPLSAGSFIANGTSLQAGANFNIDGNGVVGGALTVSGAGGISSPNANSLGTLKVTNNATVDGTLGVTGNTGLTTVSTSGLATLATAKVNNLTAGLVQSDASGNLTTLSLPSVSGLNLFVNNQNSTDQSANFRVSGSGQVGTLSVNNAATVGGTLAVAGNTSIGTGLSPANLTVTGQTNTNILNVTNASTLAGLTAGATTVASAQVSNLAGAGDRIVVANSTGALTATLALPGSAGEFIRNNPTTGIPQAADFNVSGSGKIGNILTVTGATTISGLTTLNSGIVGTGGSTFSGGTTINNGLTSNNGLTVSGGATVNNGLTVNNSFTVNSAATISTLNGVGTRLVTADVNGTLSTTPTVIPGTGDFVANQNTNDQAANFRISGEGRIGTDLTVKGSTNLTNTTIGTGGSNANLTVNGNATVSSLTTVTNSNTAPSTFVVASPTGQLSTVSNAFLTGGFIQNFTGAAFPPATRQTANFSINGTGVVNALQVGVNVVPTGTAAVITGDTRILGNASVGLIPSATPLTQGLTVRGSVLPDAANVNNLLGNPSLGVTGLNPAGRIWGGMYSLTANVGLPTTVAGANDPANPDGPTIDRLSVNGNVVPAYDNLSNLGSTTLKWANVYAGKVFTADGTISTSDGRLKTNVSGLTYGLQTVLAMRPVRYAWKKTPTATNKIGFIAQEVQQLVPEVVATGTDANHTLGIDYAGLVPVLVKALQEQQAQLDAMRGRAEKAEASLSSFESRLRALEAGAPITAPVGAGTLAQGQR